jgi:outer membrane protein
MKESRLLFVGLLLLVPVFQARAAELSLQQAADLMFSRNPSYIQQKMQADIARNGLSEARGAYWPQVDFTQGWIRTDNPVMVFGTLLNQRSFTAANFDIGALNAPAPVADLSSKFQLGWLLFDFGRREGMVESAGIRSRMAELQLQSGRTALLQELVRRYFAVSLGAEQERTAQEALASAEGRLEQARERVDQGLVVQSDLLSAQVFAARRRQEKIEAEDGARLARAALAELLGQPEGVDVEPAPLSPREFPEHDLSWWRGQMTANRPELALARQGERLAGAQLRAARGALLPSAQAWSSYEWHGKDFAYPGKSWGAGVELKWNIFRGFSDEAQLANARIGKRQAAEKVRETENALWLQLQSAYYDFQASQQKWKVAEAALEQAAENRRIFAERYASGLVTIHDTLQAETTYNETRLLHSRNLYELYRTYAALLAAAGRPDDIRNIETITEE